MGGASGVGITRKRGILRCGLRPSGVAAPLPAVRAKRARRARAARPYGVALRPFMLQWQVGGSCFAGQRLYARSAS